MKHLLSTILILLAFLWPASSVHAFPEFTEEIMTKVLMPGGIYFFMDKDEAIARMEERHPVDVYESSAYYEFTRDGIRETYDIRFACGRVWAIKFALMGPDDDTFYESLTPLKAFIEKLRPYYFGPIYGEYDIKAALVEDENIKLEIFDSSVDGKASIHINHFLWDLFEEPELNCPGEE